MTPVPAALQSRAQAGYNISFVRFQISRSFEKEEQLIKLSVSRSTVKGMPHISWQTVIIYKIRRLKEVMPLC